MPIERFEQLEAWQTAHQLVLHVYRLTVGFPSEERFGLISQMRRAAVSIPANIAEGFKRRGQRDKVHFYNVSQASLEEVRYYNILSRDLELHAEYDHLAQQLDQSTRLLTGLIRSIERKGM